MSECILLPLFQKADGKNIDYILGAKMLILNGLEDNFVFDNPVVTIGNFDGVHIGHQKICKKVVMTAKQVGGTSICISFDPHPVRVLSPERGLKMLTQLDDKAKLLSELGLKALIIIPFDKKFSQTEPEDFIKKILIEKLGIKWLVVGHNFSFGKRKKGNTNLLRQKAKKYGFGFSVVRYAKIEGSIVSSSRLRGALQRGRVFEASAMLGRAYHVKGIVIKGTGRGSTILNIPTANIQSNNEIIPKDGVYAVRVTLCSQMNNLESSPQNEVVGKIMPKCKIYEGAANIGNNPTFGDIYNTSLEVHIFDFNRNLIGKELLVHFIERIRDEKKYPDIETLQRQIEEDIQTAKKILKKRKPPLFLGAD